MSGGIDKKVGTVEIPGAPTLRKSHDRPPIVIELPLIASPAVKTMMSLCVFGAVVFLFASVAALNSFRQDVEPSWAEIALGIAMLLFAVFGFATLASFIADARRPRPTLRIDEEGLRDERSQSSVSWRDVEWLAFYHRGKVLVAALGLRRPQAASGRLFQPEALVRWTPENEAHVLLEYLDKPAATIAEVMKALVRRHGGRVDDVYKSNGRLRL